MLLDAGQTGLTVAFDLPTQMGIDSDSPRALGEVGRVGVAIDTVDDMHALLAEIPLDKVSTSMTINATASTLLAMYIVVAEERGIARDKLSGTIQNDILKEYIARGTYIYPPEPSLALDRRGSSAFCAAEVPNWNPISISGYHIREAGATAVQELAFTFANAIEYVSRAIAAGLAIDTFAPRLSFFFAAHNDLFEEVAKFRAARRIYARIMRDRFGASDASVPPALPHADGRRHAAGAAAAEQRRPRHGAGARRGARRHAVAAHERLRRGARAADRGGGDARAAHAADRRVRIGRGAHRRSARGQLLRRASDERARDAARWRCSRSVDELGGAAKAIGASFFQEEIARSAYEHQMRVERGETVIVGVNKFADDEPPLVIPAPDFRALERDRSCASARTKAARDQRRRGGVARRAEVSERVAATPRSRRG